MCPLETANFYLNYFSHKHVFEGSRRALERPIYIHVLLFAFNSGKSAAEARRMIIETYGEAAISERTCHEWFYRLNNNFK